MLTLSLVIVLPSTTVYGQEGPVSNAPVPQDVALTPANTEKPTDGSTGSFLTWGRVFQVGLFLLNPSIGALKWAIGNEIADSIPEVHDAKQQAMQSTLEAVLPVATPVMSPVVGLVGLVPGAGSAVTTALEGLKLLDKPVFSDSVPTQVQPSGGLDVTQPIPTAPAWIQPIIIGQDPDSYQTDPGSSNSYALPESSVMYQPESDAPIPQSSIAGPFNAGWNLTNTPSEYQSDAWMPYSYSNREYVPSTVDSQNSLLTYTSQEIRSDTVVGGSAEDRSQPYDWGGGQVTLDWSDFNSEGSSYNWTF